MTRSHTTLTEELAETQAKLQHLLAREAQLQAALATHCNAPLPQPRPGWPIRRLTPDAGLNLH